VRLALDNKASPSPSGDGEGKKVLFFNSLGFKPQAIEKKSKKIDQRNVNLKFNDN
jgi:hypothetical protein